MTMIGASLIEYIEEVLEDHLYFWAAVAFGAIWLWAGLEVGGGLWVRAIVGLIVAMVLFFIGMVGLVLPLILVPSALLSAWLFARAMHPDERAREIESLRQARRARLEVETQAQTMTPPAQRHHTVLLGLLALWLGWQLGKDKDEGT